MVAIGKHCESGFPHGLVGQRLAVHSCFIISALSDHGFGGQGLSLLSFGKVSVFMVCGAWKDIGSTG